MGHATFQVATGLTAAIVCMAAGIISALHLWHPGWWPDDDHCGCIYIRSGKNASVEPYFLPQTAYPASACWLIQPPKRRCTVGIHLCRGNGSSVPTERSSGRPPERLVAAYDELLQETLFDAVCFPVVSLCLFVALSMHLRNAAHRLQLAHIRIMDGLRNKAHMQNADKITACKESPVVLGGDSPKSDVTRPHFIYAEPQLVVPPLQADKLDDKPAVLDGVNTTEDVVSKEAASYFHTSPKEPPPYSLFDATGFYGPIGTNHRKGVPTRHRSNSLVCSGACGALHAMVIFLTVACVTGTYSSHRLRSCDAFVPRFAYWHAGVLSAGCLVLLYYVSLIAERFGICRRSGKHSDGDCYVCESCCSRIISKIICTILTLSVLAALVYVLYIYVIKPKIA